MSASRHIQIKGQKVQALLLSLVRHVVAQLSRPLRTILLTLDADQADHRNQQGIQSWKEELFISSHVSLYTGFYVVGEPSQSSSVVTKGVRPNFSGLVLYDGNEVIEVGIQNAESAGEDSDHTGTLSEIQYLRATREQRRPLGSLFRDRIFT